MKSTLARYALPCTLLLAGVAGVAPSAFADEWDKKTVITTNAPIEVPGAVLQPGKYMMRLLDSPSDRHIVEITSPDRKHLYAIVMTVSAYKLNPSSKTILTFYEMPAGQPEALRYWFWPGDLNGQEFTYPHKRALEISQVTGVKVKETPEDFNAQSAHKHTEEEKISEGQAVTFDQSTVSQNETPEITEQAPQEVAQVTPPPPVTDVPQPPPPAPEPIAAAPAPEPVTLAQNNDIQQLPQTGSDLPLAALIGGLSLFAAVALRLATNRG